MILLATIAIAATNPQGMVKLGGFSLSDPQGVIDLSGVWSFYAGDSLTFARPSLDEVKWEQRHVPMNDAGASYRWAGKGWYRLHVRLSQEVAGMDQMISLGPVREAAEVYVNGALVAERGRLSSRPSGGMRLLPLTAIIPGKLLVAGDNVIAIRVYDPTFNGGIVSGPLLLGTPQAVRARADPRAAASFAVAVGLGLVCLCIGLGQLLARNRSHNHEAAWLIASTFSLAIYLLSGTGLLETSLPSLELATRLPLIGALVSALCLTQYFSLRYDVGVQSEWPVVLIALCVSVLFLLFAPASWYFVLARPLALGIVLLGALYAANVSGQALRRQEARGMTVFAIAMGLVVVAVADALTASRGDIFPAWSAIGGVAALVGLTFVEVRQSSDEFSAAITRVQTLEKQLEERAQIGLLEAAALSIKNSRAFLEVAIREAAIVLNVRRCTLVVAGLGEEVRIAAAVGLPRQAMQSPIARENSIVGWVFAHGELMSNDNMPEELSLTQRAGNYQTSAFISCPVLNGGRTVGVLNVSDKNTGVGFSDEDKQAVTEVCNRLAMVLARTG